MKWIPFEEASPEPNTVIYITKNPKLLIVKGKTKDNKTVCLEKAFDTSPLIAGKTYVVPILYLRMLSYRWSIGNVE